jgi:hypothetical protein
MITRNEIEKMAIEFDNNLKRHPMSNVELREDLTDFADQVVKKLNMPVVSNRRELYFAFMEEYNALMGEGEHQILKEEVEVLLAKYSC